MNALTDPDHRVDPDTRPVIGDALYYQTVLVALFGELATERRAEA